MCGTEIYPRTSVPLALRLRGACTAAETRHVNSTLFSGRRKKNIGSKFHRDGRAALYLLARSLARSRYPDDLSIRSFFQRCTARAIEAALSPDTARSIDSVASVPRDVFFLLSLFQGGRGGETRGDVMVSCRNRVRYSGD